MKEFIYTAVDNDGVPQTGQIKALNKTQAAISLRSRNFIVTKLDEETKTSIGDIITRFRGVPGQEKIIFTRQLGTMIGAGLPINQALRVLGAQTSNNYFAKVIDDVAIQVDGGASLFEALSAHEKVFGRLYTSLIKAGEASGNLENIFSRLADTLEAEGNFKGKVKGAMVYPIIIVIVMIGVLMVMFLFVVPRLAALYKDLNADLPFVTQLLINFSEASVKYWWLVTALLVGGFFGLRRLMLKPEVNMSMSRALLKAPVFGALTTEVQLTSFTRTLSMLASSGIPLLEAIEISKETLTNLVFRSAAEEAAQQIEKGKPMAEAFRRHKEFPGMLAEMLAVGEQTGKVDEVLMKVSEYFEGQANRKTENLASAIEPIVMVILGVMVGFLVISLILPIYSLTNQF